ncbi:MAG: hypothetical protein EXS38_11780 [Opitutus sp.]|nr:hypothetical protein [Opitutus sp.]
MKNLSRLPPWLAGYAVVRRMHQLEAAGQSAEAMALAVSAQHDAPSLAVGLALAQRLRAAGDLDGPARTLGFAPLLKSFEPGEWALAREVAQLLDACGRPARAFEMWRNLLSGSALPREVRLPWLADARATALGARECVQASAWLIEIDRPNEPQTPRL